MGLHFWTNIKKKFRYNHRDVFGIMCELFFPIVFIIVGILLGKVGLYLVQNLPGVNLSLQKVGSTSLGNSIPLPQNMYYSKTENPLLNTALIASFEDNFNHLNKGNFNLKQFKNYEGSNTNQWLDNLSTFDKDV